MDLSNFNLTKHADKGADMQVAHPVTKEPLSGVFITLLGADSTEYRNRLSKLRQRLIGAKKGPNIDEVESVAMDNRVACTVAWKGLEMNGKPIECTPENVREIYGNGGYAWLVEQVDLFIGDRANFFGMADSN